MQTQERIDDYLDKLDEEYVETKEGMITEHKMLEEFDGIRVHSFRADGIFYGTPNLYFKVEREDGQMASVNHYYVIKLMKGKEVERWNFDKMDCVYWGDEYMPFMEIEDNDLIQF